MGLVDPGWLEVECDVCGNTEDFVTTFYGDGTVGVSEESLAEKEWTFNGTDWICPACGSEVIE